MIYNLIYKIQLTFTKNKKKPVMIKEKKITNATIENNKVIGAELLDVEEMENTSVKENTVYLPPPANVSLFYRAIIDIIVGLAIAFIIYKLGWG